MTANWREKVQKFAHKVFQMIKKPEMRILGSMSSSVGGTKN